MYNLHCHSIHSHDGKSTVFEMCEEAIKQNLQGLAITDHVDLIFYEQRNVYKEIKASIENTKKAKELYKDKLNVLVGLEMGEATLYPQLAEEIFALGNVDFVLASRHFVPSFGHESDFGYSDIPLWSNAKIGRFLDEYYEELLKMVETTDFDSLSHLTLPLRYINGHYNKGYDITKHDKIIESLLKALAKKEKALEINTSNYNSHNIFMPNDYYIKMFLSLGGKYFTVGSDSHITTKMTNGLKEGYQLLKDLGVKDFYYYENRKPKKFKWC